MDAVRDADRPERPPAGEQAQLRVVVELRGGEPVAERFRACRQALPDRLDGRVVHRQRGAGVFLPCPEAGVDREFGMQHDRKPGVVVEGAVSGIQIALGRQPFGKQQGVALELDVEVFDGPHVTVLNDGGAIDEPPGRDQHAVGKDANSAWLLDRFEQFWKESEEIIPRASAALLRNDLRGFGELVQKSQFAAESLLRNQVPETIWLAEAALSLGAYAASAFGAGFGGSVWALVPCAEAAQFARSWQKMYECSSHMAAASSKFFVTSAGPSLVRLSN